MKELECGAVIAGCDATFEGETEESLLQQAALHAREVHGMEEIAPEVIDQMRAAIHDRDSR